ncbi:uncharacterized protein [Prorops nasuta]|uniref:uncharacterized protein n=1 Tax=Prorops nasuta TaxID=863751 RepID=UPI0034CD564C
MTHLQRTPPSAGLLGERRGSTLMDFEIATNSPANAHQGTHQENGQIETLPQTQISAKPIASEVQAVWKQQLPNFLAEAPDIWFYLIEAEFSAARVTSEETKYLAVLRALDAGTLKLLTDVLRDLPEKEKYRHLKTVLLNRFVESRTKQVDRLLKSLALGDKKPSVLLREMRDLAKGEVGNEILHQLWLERLPAHVRPHLLTSNHLDLDGVAEMADRLIEVFNTSYVMATSSNNQEQATNLKIEQKLNDMQALILNCMQELKELKMGACSTGASPTRRHYPRSRSRSKTPSRSQNNLCYYHQRFGKQAKKCTEGCILNESFGKQQGN